MDHLLSGASGSNDELLADAAAYGIIMPEGTAPEVYSVWPENMAAVELFVRSMTQWRATSSGVIGLDYSVVLELASLYGIEDRAAVLEKVQVMELHARDRINEELERRSR